MQLTYTSQKIFDFQAEMNRTFSDAARQFGVSVQTPVAVSEIGGAHAFAAADLDPDTSIDKLFEKETVLFVVAVDFEKERRIQNGVYAIITNPEEGGVVLKAPDGSIVGPARMMLGEPGGDLESGIDCTTIPTDVNTVSFCCTYSFDLPYVHVQGNICMWYRIPQVPLP